MQDVIKQVKLHTGGPVLKNTVLHWMISGAARLDLLIWQAQVGFLMIYCSTWVSGHQLPGDNLFRNNMKAVSGLEIVLSATHSPKLGHGGKKMKEMFHSNDVFQTEHWGQWFPTGVVSVRPSVCPEVATQVSSTKIYTPGHFLSCLLHN